MAAALVCLSAAPAAAVEGDTDLTDRFGAGVEVGYPANGFSFNWFTAQNTSVQADVAMWFKKDWTGIGLRADLLWWMPRLARFEFADLMWYWGPGGNVFMWTEKGQSRHGSRQSLAAELAVGLGFRFTGVPVDMNLEFVPVLQVLSDSGTDVDPGLAAAINSRYYF